MKSRLLYTACVILAACAPKHPSAALNVPGSSLSPTDSPDHVGEKRNHTENTARRPEPAAAKAEAAAAPVAATLRPGRPLAERKKDLLFRVEGLPHDEADRVRLTLPLIPREEIFNRTIDPNKRLREYTFQASTEGECATIERALLEFLR